MGNCSIFEKKIIQQKGKTQHFCIQDYVLHTKIKFCMQKIFFFGKCLFAYKFRFAVEKKNKRKFWGNFKNT